MSREEQQCKIEVNVTGICFRETESDIEVLIVKRRSDRKIYPNQWECGGGQVCAGENFEEAIKREMEEELGVIIDRVLVFNTYEIETPDLPQKKIPGLRFVCFWHSYVNGENPMIDEKEHSEWKWQSINNLSDLDFAPNLKRDIAIGWEFYSNNKNLLERR